MAILNENINEFEDGDVPFDPRPIDDVPINSVPLDPLPIQPNPFICLDINGNPINSFVLKDDGQIKGLYNTGIGKNSKFLNISPIIGEVAPNNIEVDLSEECCTTLGYFFNNGKCFWKEDCFIKNETDIFLNPNSNNAVLFQQDENQNCSLDISFDYLIHFDCKTLYDCYINNKELCEVQIGYKTTRVNPTFTFTLSNGIDTVEFSQTLTSNNILNIYGEIYNIIATNEIFNDIDFSYNILGPGDDILNGLDDFKEVLSIKHNGDCNLISINVTGGVSITGQSIFGGAIESDLSSAVTVKKEVNNKKLIDYFSCVDIDFNLEYVNNTINNNDIIDGQIYDESSMLYEKVFTEKLYNINFLELLNQENTGLLLNGEENYCNILNNIIIDELGDNCNLFTESTLNSAWLTFNRTISNPLIIEKIKNKFINISLTIKNPCCEFSLLIDNIKLNKKCSEDIIEKQNILDCVGFDLERVIDNKKSWFIDENERFYDFFTRDTDYVTKDERLVINTKEVELELSTARGIEYDVYCYLKDNECLFDKNISFSGVTCECSTLSIINDIDCCGDSGLSFKYDSEMFASYDKFKSEIYNFINVKNRKTIQSYSTLRAIYDRYLNSLNYCFIKSKEYNYDDILKYIYYFGSNWVELVEQLIPATTIWQSSIKIKNTLFDDAKFVYKRYSLFTCDTECDVIGVDTNVDVDIYDITNNSNDCKIEDTVVYCKGVYHFNIDDGSEFYSGGCSVAGNNGIIEEIIE